MKFITTIILALTLVSFTSCNKGSADQKLKEIDSSQIDQENPPVLEFEEKEFDFGKIARDERVTHEFKFKNTGKSPLIIVDAKSTCGCTVPEIPNEPIQPGESGSITVHFNSALKSGEVTKVITVSANTYPEKFTKIQIKATIPTE